MVLSDCIFSIHISLSQPRLKCLIHIVKRLSEEHKDFITALLPEVQTQIRAFKQTNTLSTAMYYFLWGCSLCQVIICTKEVSVGARKNAYSLLVEIGKAFVRFCGNTKGNTPVFLLLCMFGCKFLILET